MHLIILFRTKFGMHHVDFNDTDRPRKPKLSAQFYKKLIKERKLLPCQDSQDFCELTDN